MTEVEQQQQSMAEISPTTFDEVSMERSKGFVKALQELKNLRPQLYSAAEYCEKSYLHSEQKQMVLDNVRDYAVRALVNAVDHLGTVAYKLTDLLEQQNLDVSNMELKVSCLDQKILTCRTYMNKEGLRQQQLLAVIPRHHKHYTLPNSISKKVHFSPRAKTDFKQCLFQARAHDEPAGNPSAQTLSWHSGSETKSTLKGAQAPEALMSARESKASGKTNVLFHVLDDERGIQTKPPGYLRLHNVGPVSNAVVQTFDIMHMDPSEGSKPLTAFRSFDNHHKREIVRAPVRSRSVISAFFAKQKTSKLKAGYVS